MIDRMSDNDSRDLSRRALLQSAAFVPVAALMAPAQQTRQSVLSPAQMKTLVAFIDRLIPTDELGPGAVESGAQIYIDRALAGPNAAEKDSFVRGLEAVDAYARRVHGAPVAELSAEKRDQFLAELAAGNLPESPFFNRARRLTLEGMFGDPYYGGNRNFAGWDLIRYPGPRPAVAPEDQKMDVEIKPYRVSAWGAKYGH
jgi:gluconate 2-dehydrogenase gamma chain